MCECCCNAVGFCCSCLYGIGRSIPVMSILSFILFLTGYSLTISGRAATTQPLETMGVTTLTAFLQDLEVAFFFAFVPQLMSEHLTSCAPFRSFLVHIFRFPSIFQKLGRLRSSMGWVSLLHFWPAERLEKCFSSRRTTAAHHAFSFCLVVAHLDSY